jgi:hypothetical protein
MSSGNSFGGTGDAQNNVDLTVLFKAVNRTRERNVLRHSQSSWIEPHT